MLVSLAIPVYNVEEYVERALLSALNQTYHNIEYLIVDDKGTDQSMEVVRNVIAAHPRGLDVKIIEHPVNLGLGEASNTAIDHAKGKYLYFMDSDDEITPDCIQKLYDEMQRTDVDVVLASHKVVGNIHINKRVSEDKWIYARTYCNQKEEIIMSFPNNVKYYITRWNKLYNLSFLKEYRIRCRQRISEDVFFTFQVLLNAQSYSSIPDITYLYHIRNDSICGKGVTETMCEQWKRKLIDMYGYLAEYSAGTALRIKIKKKLFKKRFCLAKQVLESPYPVQHYINDYLSPLFFKDRDTFRSLFLFAGWLFSIMPLPVKQAFIVLIFVLWRRALKPLRSKLLQR